MLERIKAAYQANDLRQVDEPNEHANSLVLLGKELQSGMEAE